MTERIKFRITLDQGASMPVRAHGTDAGYDLHVKSVKFRVNKYGKAQLVIDTGVHIQPLDTSYYIEVVPNSRVCKNNLRMANSVAVIDPGYTGSIHVIYDVKQCAKQADGLFTLAPDEVDAWLELVQPGMVCAQMLVRKRYAIEFMEEQLEETERGDGGFGSTAAAAGQTPAK